MAATMAAGALGAVARAWLSGWAQRRWRRHGAGTTIVNLVGAFALGLWWAHGAAFGSAATTLVGVGFLGAFTTFSTWLAEVGATWRSGRRAPALLEAVATLFVGVAAAYLGMITGSG
jgi:fluoride exporter